MVELQFMETHNPTSNKNNSNNNNILPFIALLLWPGLLNALSHLTHATAVWELSFQFYS